MTIDAMTNPHTIEIQGCSTKYKVVNGIYDRIPKDHNGKLCYEKRQGTPEELRCFIFHSGISRWVISTRIDDGACCYAYLNHDSDAPSDDITKCKGSWFTWVDDNDNPWKPVKIVCSAVQGPTDILANITLDKDEMKMHFSTQARPHQHDTPQPAATVKKTFDQDEMQRLFATQARPHQNDTTQPASIVKKGNESRHKNRILPLQSDSSGRPKTKPKRRTCLDWVLGTTIGYALAFLFAALTLILLGTVSWKLLGGTEDYDDSWDDSLWIAWGFFFDPGAHMSIPTNEPRRVRLCALIFSLFGFIFNLVFLGVVVDGIRQFLDVYKQDRDRLFLEDHIVILGWCDKTLFLLDEILSEAEQSRFSATQSRQVVVMAEREQVEMMQDIRHHFPDHLWRIRCVRARTGCAYDLDDLLRASIGAARNVIVLASDGSPRDCDLEVVRICVALASLPNGQELSGRVIAEVRCMEVAHVLKKLLPNADGIHARSNANRVFCWCAAVPLVGHCFLSLCSFAEGEELYVCDMPKRCEGKTFGEVCKSFAEAVVIGIQYASKEVKLAPRDDKLVTLQDRLILMASDASEVHKDVKLLRGGSVEWQKGQRVGTVHPVEDGKAASMIAAGSSILPLKLPAEKKKVFIILGWPNDFVDLARDLDSVSPHGSVIHVLALKPTEIRKAALDGAKFQNLTIYQQLGDRRNVQHLKTKVQLSTAFSILIVAESMGETRTENGFCLDFGEEDTAGDDAITSDSACLMCLLIVDGILEDLKDENGLAILGPHVICEVLDPRTDRLLLRNADLGTKATFFRSNLIETGMFMMAATDDGPVIFNALRSLMSKEYGAYLREVSLTSLHEQWIPGHYSFWELHDLMRSHGAILVAWVSCEHITSDGPKRSDVRLFYPSAAEKNHQQWWNGTESLLVICQPDGHLQPTLGISPSIM